MTKNNSPTLKVNSADSAPSTRSKENKGTLQGRLERFESGSAKDEGNVRYFAGDLREKLTMANLLSATIDHFDQVDILVNACRQVMVTDPLGVDDDTTETMLQQNLLNSLRLSQLVARRMIKQAAGNVESQIGSIINLSSIAARRAHPDLMAYSIATAASDQMTRSLAVALAW